MFVIPAEGLKIIDPDLKDVLPAEGREVPPSDYWIRRLRDGDVVEGNASVAPKKAAKNAPAADQ